MTWSPLYMAAGEDNEQPKYGQFKHGACYVGCGPVAWAIVFGWADRQAALGNASCALAWGVYRQDGGYGNDVEAPIKMDDGVRNMTREINGHVGTWCVPFTESGATFPWDMDRARGYLLWRSPIGLGVAYNVFGIPDDHLRNLVISSIVYYKTPAIIGTGWFEHYPVAYGYQYEQRVIRRSFLWWSWSEVVYMQYFKVNQGQEGRGNGMIPAYTWFAGLLYTYPF